MTIDQEPRGQAGKTNARENPVTTDRFFPSIQKATFTATRKTLDKR